VSILDAPRAIVGVDGCKGGWIAASKLRGQPPHATIYKAFADIARDLPEALIAVDMPIGLPDAGSRFGRATEQALKAVLGRARNTIFPIPSRAAVYAETGKLNGMAEIGAAFQRALAVARETSDPPGGFSRQAFMIFPKIREIDAALRSDAELASRVIESHPEAAFWRMNGRRDLRHPKKLDAGKTERMEVLQGWGFDAAWFASAREQVRRDKPSGLSVGWDDLLDACAMLVVAARHAEGACESFPDPPGRDACGLPVAIWV
jgi:predicted RNase H-like nuclease